jgi:2-keto-4-pentenoate hydratase/2-oxohepta-3-ene-1,7-dioic acid hydratase in catechol pathway
MPRNLPIDIPSKIICVGLNYRLHAEEGGLPIPESPVLFAKWSSALIGDGEPIVLPSQSSAVDYEAELAVVIGRTARNVSAADALDHVAGYLIMNDVTARDLQASDGQWTRSKSFDTFGPIGPRLVPASDIPDPQALGIRAWLNDELVQDSTTSDMIFSVAEVIEFISAGATLLPGDVISTGTPSGVGLHRDPPRLLQAGDRIRVEIDGLGRLENPVE